MQCARAETDFCTRQCCGPQRPFTIKVLDNSGREVMRASRPCRCQSCCCPCCLQEVTIEAPPGNVIGKVEQEWTLCAPGFRVLDPAGNTVLRIEGPCCPCKCFSDVVFRVKSADGSAEVGRITKQFSGLLKEYFTDAGTPSRTGPERLQPFTSPRAPTRCTRASSRLFPDICSLYSL